MSSLSIGDIQDHRWWKGQIQSEFVRQWQSVLVHFGHLGRTTMDTGDEYNICFVVHPIADVQRTILQ